MEIYDISLPINSELPVWPGDPPISISQMNSMDEGKSNNTSFLSMGVHSGTHIDAPHHFLNNHLSVDKISLDRLIGKVFVIKMPKKCSVITDAILDNIEIPNKIDRILFKTENSSLWEKDELTFNTNFVAVDESGAKWLVDHKIKLVGVDYLSVAPYRKGTPTHTILLEAEIVVIEGLNLSGIKQGIYEMVCLPLKVIDTDGAPARVILRSIKE